MGVLKALPCPPGTNFIKNTIIQFNNVLTITKNPGYVVGQVYCFKVDY
jgi:hypothetical protein